MNQQELQARVIKIAGEVLKEKQYVSPIDILLGIGYLQLSHLQDWRKGKVNYLERVIHANLKKISSAMRFFRQWAKQHDLKPSETKYMRSNGSLQFSKSGDANIELAYRTHYVSPLLSEIKQKNLQEKLEKEPEKVVFCILKDSKCEQCHQVLSKGSFLYKEQEKALCMSCAGFDSFAFLPAGDAKLTRQAKKLSQSYAVVVKFSRARNRYERQGLLVEEKALDHVIEELGIK